MSEVSTEVPALGRQKWQHALERLRTIGILNAFYGHSFAHTTFEESTTCGHCSRKITCPEGYKCKFCDLNFHKECRDGMVTFVNICPRIKLPPEIPPGRQYKGQVHDEPPSLLEERGRIHLRFSTERLDERKWRLIIQVMECRNLPPMDSNGLADPYVKLSLLEDKDTTKQKSERREKTLNPNFGEKFFFDVSDVDLVKHVYIEVWDYNCLSRNRIIGSMSVEMSDLISDTQEERVDQWYMLLEESQGRKQSMRIRSSEEAEKPKMTLDDFKLKEILGQGSFGKVFLAEHKASKQVYALKSIRKIGLGEDIEYLFSERKILSLQGKYQFFPSLHYCFQNHDHLFFVMEYIDGGDLSHHLMEFGRFSEGQTRFYAAETVLGLMYLHDRGIIYRDLKPSNIMLDNEGHIRIVDFGLCKEGIRAGNKTNTFCGTPEYMAPEIISCKAYDTSVDWWALGIMIYEMILGRPPFNGDHDEQLFRNILQKSVRYPLGMSQHSVSIIEGFLDKNPNNRLGCRGHEDVLNHVFFKKINWRKLEDRETKPPYIPKIKNKSFPLHLKKKRVALSNIEEDSCTVDPKAFNGFTYISPDM